MNEYDFIKVQITNNWERERQMRYSMCTRASIVESLYTKLHKEMTVSAIQCVFGERNEDFQAIVSFCCKVQNKKIALKIHSERGKHALGGCFFSD